MRSNRAVFAAVLTALATGIAGAQQFPNKPVRMIVPFPPGGSTDLVARVVGQKLSDLWGQQVVIDNRGGANGMIGSDLVAKAVADGYTAVLGTIGPFAINASLYKMQYDIVRDFAPITYTANIANVLVVHPGVAAKDVRELVALAKAKPGQLSFGSSGTGGAPHMAVELFRRRRFLSSRRASCAHSASALRSVRPHCRIRPPLPRPALPVFRCSTGRDCLRRRKRRRRSLQNSMRMSFVYWQCPMWSNA